jgi:hypothetical protein
MSNTITPTVFDRTLNVERVEILSIGYAMEGPEIES